jgi:cystathionine gamma-synthase
MFSPQPGYGSLLSVTFTSLEVAKVFYSALPCYKGPSLGAVFTLAIPFTVAAFPPEKMAWVKEHHLDQTLVSSKFSFFGIESGLLLLLSQVRIGVGMEELSSLLNGVTLALKKAEEFCTGHNV